MPLSASTGVQLSTRKRISALLLEDQLILYNIGLFKLIIACRLGNGSVDVCGEKRVLRLEHLLCLKREKKGKNSLLDLIVIVTRSNHAVTPSGDLIGCWDPFFVSNRCLVRYIYCKTHAELLWLAMREWNAMTLLLICPTSFSGSLTLTGKYYFPGGHMTHELKSFTIATV